LASMVHNGSPEAGTAPHAFWTTSKKPGSFSQLLKPEPERSRPDGRAGHNKSIKIICDSAKRNLWNHPHTYVVIWTSELSVLHQICLWNNLVPEADTIFDHFIYRNARTLVREQPERVRRVRKSRAHANEQMYVYERRKT
jgi:hypothetical protein